MADVLERHELPAGCLAVEVTETVLASDLDAARAELEGVRRLGVRLLLDDFGTGYSSLGYLPELPFDVLKIDRRFVARSIEPNGARLMAGVIGLGRALGMDVLAEGIETESELEQCRRLGCDLFQGYYFGRPAPADADGLPDSLKSRAARN